MATKKFKGKRYAAKIVMHEVEYEYHDPIIPSVSNSLHIHISYKGMNNMYSMICPDDEKYQRELFAEYIKEAVVKALLEGENQ
jgi:hypothetical protein